MKKLSVLLGATAATSLMLLTVTFAVNHNNKAAALKKGEVQADGGAPLPSPVPPPHGRATFLKDGGAPLPSPVPPPHRNRLATA